MLKSATPMKLKTNQLLITKNLKITRRGPADKL